MHRKSAKVRNSSPSPPLPLRHSPTHAPCLPAHPSQLRTPFQLRPRCVSLTVECPGVGERVVVQAVGPECVVLATESLVIARRYLHSDDGPNHSSRTSSLVVCTRIRTSREIHEYMHTHLFFSENRLHVVSQLCDAPDWRPNNISYAVLCHCHALRHLSRCYVVLSTLPSRRGACRSCPAYARAREAEEGRWGWPGLAGDRFGTGKMVMRGS